MVRLKSNTWKVLCVKNLGAQWSKLLRNNEPFVIRFTHVLPPYHPFSLFKGRGVIGELLLILQHIVLFLFCYTTFISTLLFTARLFIVPRFGLFVVFAACARETVKISLSFVRYKLGPPHSQPGTISSTNTKQLLCHLLSLLLSFCD